jgi:hypothetical protein
MSCDPLPLPSPHTTIYLNILRDTEQRETGHNQQDRSTPRTMKPHDSTEKS